MTDIRISIANTSPDGGTFLTPLWVAFHDNSFDLFNGGEAASPGLEALAEDGTFGAIDAEVFEVDADGQVGAITGEAGPIATGEQASTVIDVDASSNAYFNYAAMILPSNDAFIGNGNAILLFDEDGEFLGARTIELEGEDVYDAGTEVNTELDAAFINQTGPDTGVDENGVVRFHPGFNGSLGNPDGEGDQIILGGTNAFGVDIDEVAADFTQPGSTIATIHVNEAVTTELDEGERRFIGSEVDDLVTGSDTRNVIRVGNGWDEVQAGDGNDVVRAGRGNDVVYGQDGNDLLFGGRGSDMVVGGEGDDLVHLGRGAVADVFVFATGDGFDQVFNFDELDTILLDVDGIDTAEAALETAIEVADGVLLNLDGDAIFLRDLSLDDLSVDNIEIA